MTDYAELFDGAPCGYLITEDDGTIVMVNATFVQWSGHQRDMIVGTRLQQLLPIGDQILYSTHCIPQLGVNGAVAEIAIDVICADGTRRAALLSATRTGPSDASPARVRVIIFSAHERRLYENDLLAARRRAEASEARSVLAESDLRHRVLHDPLTGLLNRPGLIEQLSDLDGSAGEQVCLLYIDLDQFKAVNDSLGHAAGDQLLLVVAERLQSTVRKSSTMARLAGDEFVVVETITPSGQAAVLARRLLGVVNAPVVIEGLEVLPSASIGIAVSSLSVTTPDDLLRWADTAMHRAKASGGNRWEQHDPSQLDPTMDRLRLLEELRRGIDRDELRLHYQPRIDLATGSVDGVEALVRWQHPERGLLSPGGFITVAEEAGLIRSLGEWVLDAAIGQTKAWDDDPIVRPVRMAINLSTRQLSDSHLVALVSEALARHGVDPARIMLEITETAVMHDPETALSTLDDLKSLGVGLAVDDFGTGYSSLTYLKRYPVDELKIDQSFVRGLAQDTGDSAIVSSCIQLAHAMGIHAVAEGVESIEHHRKLIDLGCDLAQGYYYSPPLPVTALRPWIEARAVTRMASVMEPIIERARRGPQGIRGAVAHDAASVATDGPLVAGHQEGDPGTSALGS